MKIQLSKVFCEEKNTLQKMLSSYLTEMNLSTEYPYFDTYWQDDKRLPFFIKQNRKIVGFVLINDFIIDNDFQANQSIAEFYVKPDFRRKGIGKNVAMELFKTYQGKWEIRQQINNKNAQLFWTKVIGTFSNGNFNDRIIEVGSSKMRIQTFKS